MVVAVEIAVVEEPVVVHCLGYQIQIAQVSQLLAFLLMKDEQLEGV